MLKELLRFEVEERGRRQIAREAEVRIAQLVKDGHGARLERLHSRVGRVLEELGHEINGVLRRARAEDFAPRVRLDLRELVLGVILVHRLDLVEGGRAEHLDNLDQLVDPRLAGEEGHAKEQLSEHAARRPHVNAARVVRRSENELRRAVVARANVRDVGLALDQDLRRAEIAKLEHVRLRMYEQVLRLDVAMADAKRVDVRE
mmetsp:Transcript_30501/g.79201  ORF Transcript_30501/g.79201 Transcript_30501/m.79201 type:complete len:203 (-) Transcript_30501:740-1348(-)